MNECMYVRMGVCMKVCTLSLYVCTGYHLLSLVGRHGDESGLQEIALRAGQRQAGHAARLGLIALRVDCCCEYCIYICIIAYIGYLIMLKAK